MREGWETVRVSDIATVRSGATPSTKDPGNWDGDIPWLTPKDLSERPAKYTERGNRSITEQGLKKTTLLPAGSVLLTSRAPVGYVSIARNEISTNQGFKSLVLKSGQMPEYWYYLLQNSTDYLLDNSGGSTFKEISKRSVENLQFPVPPLHEQQRIVDLMDSVDTAISSAQAEVDAAVRLRDKVLKNELRNPASDWKQTRLGEVVTVVRGYTFPRKFQGNKDAEFAFFKVSDMNTSGNYPRMLVSPNYVSEIVIQELKAKVHPSGTVIFPRVGAALLTEKRRILDSDSLIDDNMLGVVAGERIEPQFLFLFMEQVKLAKYAQHGALPSVNQRQIRSIPINLPPFHEQERIVETMNTLDETVEASRASLDRLRELRSSMLSVLLSGEHEIPDTYDLFLELPEGKQAE